MFRWSLHDNTFAQVPLDDMSYLQTQPSSLSVWSIAFLNRFVLFCQNVGILFLRFCWISTFMIFLSLLLWWFVYCYRFYKVTAGCGGSLDTIVVSRLKIVLVDFVVFIQKSTKFNQIKTNHKHSNKLWKRRRRCCLVLIDFYIRHGVLTMENCDCDYTKLVCLLHNDLKLPGP